MRDYSISRLGVSPNDFDNQYSPRDIGLLAEGTEQKTKERFESIRFHAFLVSRLITDKIKTPDQLVTFTWEQEDKEEEKGLRGMSKEEWAAEVEKFKKKLDGK